MDSAINLIAGNKDAVAKVMKPRLAILVGPKGRGSNMTAIAGACARGSLHAQVAVVVAPTEESPAAIVAAELGLPVEIVAYEAEDGEYGSRLVALFRDLAVDIVCLAGFLRILPLEVLQAYPNQVLNIHPALLPKHGGKGMYGLRVHQAVLEAGDKQSGCTVHLVTPVYDEGEILVQKLVPVLPGDTVETLATRVLEQEHVAYAEAISIVANRLATSSSKDA